MKSLLLTFLLLLPLPAQYRIEPAGFKMEEGELRTLFMETTAVFPRPPRKDPPVFISRDSSGPIVLYQRTPRGEVAMQLDSGHHYFSQLIYQFAHELAHIRADFQPVTHENKWLEETLCETASLFALRQLALRWEKKAPNSNLYNYRQHLTSYAERVMKSREPLTPKTSPAFYQKHRKTLRKSPTERNLNGAFANLILPLLEKEPVHWRTLAHFPRQKGATLAQHFLLWRTASPRKHHSFLQKLESLFL